jgi:hypothetical protein
MEMEIIASLRRCRSGLPLALLLLPLTAGCGGKAGGTVSGTVMYQGKPLSSGVVTFVPESGAAHHADIQSDGSYRMTNAPLGLVKIGVQTKSGPSASSPSRMPTSPNDYGKLESDMKGKESQIPARYTDPNKSQVTYTVKKGKQQFDIELK